MRGFAGNLRSTSRVWRVVIGDKLIDRLQYPGISTIGAFAWYRIRKRYAAMMRNPTRLKILFFTLTALKQTGDDGSPVFGVVVEGFVVPVVSPERTGYQVGDCPHGKRESGQ